MSAGLSRALRGCVTACTLCLGHTLGFDEAFSLLQVSAQPDAPENSDTDEISIDQAVHTYPSQPLTYETLGAQHSGNSARLLGARASDSDPARSYWEIGEKLQRASHHGIAATTVHSHQIVRYVSTLHGAPRLPPGGCLYLPSDKAWDAFYSHLEHPYPPMFAEMVANAFYPNCSSVSVSGVTMHRCKDGKRILGMNGRCMQANLIGMGASVDVYAVDGHIGLPYSWHTSVRRKRAALVSTGADEQPTLKMPTDLCTETAMRTLPEVPADRMLNIPTKVVMCVKNSRQIRGDIHAFIQEQLNWTNQGYRGRSPWRRQSWDSMVPSHVDMQIQFDLKVLEIQHDDQCAQQTLGDKLGHAAPYNMDHGTMFMIAVIADDETGILGMTTFPTEKMEDDPGLMVAISTRGLRHWNSFSGENWDMTYQQGHTMTHEVGHGLGVFHTFEGGCGEIGDQVSDTEPEAYPHYMCSSGDSCNTEDPIHNFMDYAPDECMAGFTEHQKRRAWCAVETYRPTLFKAALTTFRDA